MIDPDLSALARLNPVPGARVAGAARSTWGEAALAHVLSGETRPRQRRRWAGVVAGAAGLAALAALVVVLVVATGGGANQSDSAPSGDAATSVTLRLAPGTPNAPAALDLARAALAERATRLGIGSVSVQRDGDRLALSVPSATERQVDALISPGQLAVYAFASAARDPAGTTVRADAEARAQPGDALVSDGTRFYVLRAGTSAFGSANVTAARVEGTTVTVQLDEAGQRAFGLVTRRVAQDGRLAGHPQAMAVVVDGRLLTLATIDFDQYPDGIDGRNGFQMPLAEGDAAVVAAQILTPLPPLRVVGGG